MTRFHQRTTLPGDKGGDASASPPIPQQVGPYAIEGLIKKGGMSLLYLTAHPDTREPIAVKVLSPQYMSHPEMMARFLREATIIGMADHPNIIKLYGQGEWEGGLYIAMEFIQGVSLREYLAQHPLTLKKALEIVLEIAYALCHLHTHGVIHRDLKPENILVTDEEHIKVIDFGIAQLLNQESNETVQQKRLIGTPIYMSPEQRKDPESVSYPSDIYSLGIIAYELVLGKISKGQIHLSMMPKGLQRILSKSLQPKPQDRYLDVVDFASDLNVYLHSELLTRDEAQTDPTSDLFDAFQHAYTHLVPAKPPQMSAFEIGMALHKAMGIPGLYYDFFEHTDGSLVIVMGEPSTKGGEAFAYAAVLRGMVRTLLEKTSDLSLFATQLNTLVIQDTLDIPFLLNCLKLNPHTHAGTFISCAFGDLWKQGTKLSQPNLALGIDATTLFTPLHFHYTPGDLILLAPILSWTPVDPEFSESDPQKWVDHLLRKCRAQSLEDRTVCLVALKART